MIVYKYNICNVPDEEVFLKQCEALERHIPRIIKGDIHTDVDGSKTQLYTLQDSKIIIHNSYYIGAVYIDSEIELEQYF